MELKTAVSQIALNVMKELKNSAKSLKLQQELWDDVL